MWHNAQSKAVLYDRALLYFVDTVLLYFLLKDPLKYVTVNLLIFLYYIIYLLNINIYIYICIFNIYDVQILPGLQSVKREQMDNRTFEIVNAGDQLSFNMSKQITP